MANERRPEQESFHDVIDLIRKGASSAPVYRIINIPLDTARSGEELALAGYNFQVIDASDPFAFAEIQFNETLANKVPFRRGDQVITPFYRFYIHNTAQLGKFLKIAISAHFDLWRFIPNPFASAIINNIFDPSTPGLRPALSENASGTVFRGHFTVGGAAGTTSIIQVRNPIGSGRKVVVRAFQQLNPSPINVIGRIRDAALTNLHVFNPMSNINTTIAAPRDVAKAEIRWDRITTAAFAAFIATAGRVQWQSVAAFFDDIMASYHYCFLNEGDGVIFYPGNGSIGTDTTEPVNIEATLISAIISTFEW